MDEWVADCKNRGWQQLIGCKAKAWRRLALSTALNQILLPNPSLFFTLADDLRKLCIVLTSLAKKQDHAETSDCLLSPYNCCRHSPALVLVCGSRLLAWPTCMAITTPLSASIGTSSLTYLLTSAISGSHTTLER